ncbi:MAG: right-handed parallel beta-helix repeat-containing protein [Planctomycetota bacterium]|nr:right-handed parallel beta-helix repeat-containing protein [Planctomycetota bacterium]
MPRIVHTTLLAIALSLQAIETTHGADIYVDNQLGNDAYDGTNERATDEVNGPVRTIGKALKVSNRGDVIHIKDNGQPYRESLAIAGIRHCGVPGVPLRILGGGAVISGDRPLPLGSWHHVGKLLYQVTPRHKGYYQLLLDGKVVPEVAVPQSAIVRPKLPEQQWLAWNGSIYYQAVRGEDPEQMPFTIAALGMGLSMYRVHDVIVTNLTFKHFRLDGVNLHDQCSRVFLQNVKGLENGRAGIAIGGTSMAAVHDSEFSNNRTYSLLLTESGGADVKNTTFSTAPVQK